jgi:hypothetical protein
VHLDDLHHVPAVHGEVLLGHRLHGWTTIVPNGRALGVFQWVDAPKADP